MVEKRTRKSKSTSGATTLARVRRCVRKLSGVEERLSRGTPVFCVGDPQFAMVVDDHHGAECAGVWARCADGLQAYLVLSDAKRYFVPPYLGAKGWIGIRIDARADWKAIESLLQDAHAITARGRRR